MTTIVIRTAHTRVPPCRDRRRRHRPPRPL